MSKSIIALFAVAGLTATTATAQVRMQEIGRVNVQSFFSSANPSNIGTNAMAVAWNGTDLYVSGFRNATAQTDGTGILRVNNPLVNGTSSTSTFGVLSTPLFTGFSGMDINGTTLATTYDRNGNSTNSIRAFNLDASNSLRWNGPNTRGMSGTAFNPGINGTGGLGSGVSHLIQGDGFERVYNVATGAGNASPSGAINSVGGGEFAMNASGFTAYRDVDFDPRTGDGYFRANNSVARAVRSDAGGYNSGGLSPQIVARAAANTVGTNIQFLDTAAGNFLIFNDRASGATGQNFNDVMLASDLAGNLQTLQFLSPSGGAFTPFGTGIALYDFSFDSASQTLAVSDFSSNVVYIFQIPTPSAAALLGLGGLVAFRRRR